ncbi:ATP-binding cassette domain-containing protein [Desulfovirgula thermocuniculi]|uniref:ATP-binding cassette domain-containing protein n=1 Tax=Desulfovirgula thermocuniculi TaxID=348842 RepID=UPI0004814669|nr:ATP-binding cassette domain-containing protein [Desulfovirgula thermocuniculi]
MGAIIEVEGLTKVYARGIVAVKEVTFAVEEGEIFGFLGPNGAGKSTTIMMLTTLIKPTAGRAFVAGFDVVREPGRVRLCIGYVSQELAVDDNLSGRDNLFLQAGFYHLPRGEARARCDELLKMMGLYERADDLVETYSGGMRKRLDIACGLIHRPKVLFLDEPTVGLDTQTRHQIWGYIKALREKYGMTIFMTTHYMEEADALCDRIAIIDRGVIKAVGAPAALKDRLGGDVVTLRFKEAPAEKIREAVAALEGLAGVRGVKHQDGDCFIVARGGGELIPQIFQVLQPLGVGVERVTLKRPSLDDVYLYYTGRELRDETGSKEEAMRARMLMRRVRGA